MNEPAPAKPTMAEDDKRRTLVATEHLSKYYPVGSGLFSRGERLLVGVNYMHGDMERPRGELVHIPLAKKRKQIDRTRAFKKKNAKKAEAALRRLQEVALTDGNVFEELIRTVEVATVGQVTHALWDVWGRFRASM